MNKLQYRSSEAPTPWGMTDVPMQPDCKKHCDSTGICETITSGKGVCLCRIYNEAYSRALKSWIPIRVEDQEKVNHDLWMLNRNSYGPDLKYWTPDESKLYDIPDGIELLLGRVGNNKSVLIMNGIIREATIKRLEDTKDTDSKEELQNLHAFLLGESQFGGVWFGDKVDDKPFWWRTKLRELISRIN